MSRTDLINTLRQGVPVTARLVKQIVARLEADRALESELAESERHRQILVQQGVELVAQADSLYSALENLYGRLLLCDRDGEALITKEDGEMARAALALRAGGKARA
jgi:hypothetical protein